MNKRFLVSNVLKVKFKNYKYQFTKLMRSIDKNEDNQWIFTGTRIAANKQEDVYTNYANRKSMIEKDLYAEEDNRSKNKLTQLIN